MGSEKQKKEVLERKKLLKGRKKGLYRIGLEVKKVR